MCLFCSFWDSRIAGADRLLMSADILPSAKRPFPSINTSQPFAPILASKSEQRGGQGSCSFSWTEPSTDPPSLPLSLVLPLPLLSWLWKNAQNIARVGYRREGSGEVDGKRRDWKVWWNKGNINQKCEKEAQEAVLCWSLCLGRVWVRWRGQRTLLSQLCVHKGEERLCLLHFMFSGDILTASRCVPAQTVTYFLLSSHSPSLFNFLCFSPCLTFPLLLLLLLIPASWNNRDGPCKRRSCRRRWHHSVRWYIPLALNKKQAEEKQRCLLGLLCFCRFNLHAPPVRGVFETTRWAFT